MNKKFKIYPFLIQLLYKDMLRKINTIMKFRSSKLMILRKK